MKDRKYYILVKNAKDAMALHKKLRENNIVSTLAPTPREADHCCGVCIIYENPSNIEKIKNISIEEKIEIDGFWDMENKDDPNRYRFC